MTVETIFSCLDSNQVKMGIGGPFWAFDSLLPLEDVDTCSFKLRTWFRTLLGISKIAKKQIKLYLGFLSSGNAERNWSILHKPFTLIKSSFSFKSVNKKLLGSQFLSHETFFLYNWLIFFNFEAVRTMSKSRMVSYG